MDNLRVYCIHSVWVNSVHSFRYILWNLNLKWLNSETLTEEHNTKELNTMIQVLLLSNSYEMNLFHLNPWIDSNEQCIAIQVKIPIGLNIANFPHLVKSPLTHFDTNVFHKNLRIDKCQIIQKPMNEEWRMERTGRKKTFVKTNNTELFEHFNKVYNYNKFWSRSWNTPNWMNVILNWRGYNTFEQIVD